MDWFELLTFCNLVLSFVLLILLTRIRPVRVKGYRIEKGDCSILDRYLEKAENYKKAGKKDMALLVLRNSFVNHPENTLVFKFYVEGLLEEAGYSEEQQEKLRYLMEAENALLDFSEKVGPDNFSIVEDYQEKIQKVKDGIFKQAS